MKPAQQNTRNDVRERIAALDKKLEDGVELEQASELVAAQKDVLANATKRAAVLEEEGNYDEAHATLQAAKRISERVDALQGHRLKERNEARNAEVIYRRSRRCPPRMYASRPLLLKLVSLDKFG